MDSEEARRQATEAQQAHRDAARPVLPVPTSILAALSAGVGVALVGRSASPSWLHIVVVLVGISLLGAAHAIPARYRKRSGLHGFHGQVRRDNTVFLIVAAVLVITGFTADSTLSSVFVILGVIVACVYFLLLRGVWGAPR